MPGPLAGAKVIDFSAVVSGPLASMILADQGADVVKVEAPKRPDLLRKEWFYRGGLTSLFANCNRGKRSIAIDLRSEHAHTRLASVAFRSSAIHALFCTHARNSCTVAPPTSLVQREQPCMERIHAHATNS